MPARPMLYPKAHRFLCALVPPLLPYTAKVIENYLKPKYSGQFGAQMVESIWYVAGAHHHDRRCPATRAEYKDTCIHAWLVCEPHNQELILHCPRYCAGTKALG